MNYKYSIIVLYYFSGTGNARRASEWMLAEAERKGIKTKLICIDRFTNIEIADFKDKALIGFISPTHGFNMAPLMLKFIHRFPKGLDADIFVCNTRAGTKLYKWFLPGASGAALLYPSLMLRFKGYKSRGIIPIDLPSNWFLLHPALRPKVVKSMHLHYKQKCEKTMSGLINGKYYGKAWLDLPFDLILIPVSMLYYFSGRFMLAKSYFADHNCTGCGKCAKNCPVGAIEMRKGLPFYKITCESCMRCINNCPERALQTNHLLLLIVWGLLYYFAYLATKQIDIFLNIDPYGFWGLLILIILVSCFGFISIPVFNFMFKLQRYCVVRKILAKTSLTYYKFWRRYKFNQ
ncbi:MAG: EFR1 family ferrodoxin [Bacteroidales bacterium]|jgi:ferredoxin|nr:EFR1 family ferrodoxin [Bacteroidales bacterium]